MTDVSREGASNEEIIKTIGDSLPVGVWVARAPGGEFVYANEKFRSVMGIPGLEEVARGDYAEPYAIHDREGNLYPEEEMPFVLALQARSTVMVDDIVVHRRDGRLVNIRAYARPVLVGDEVSHVVIAFFDITREVEAERARHEAEARIREAHAMESLATLAGGIAHDFNNMLGAISLLASALGQGETDPIRIQHVNAIDKVVGTASDLAESLLTFAGGGKNLSEGLSLNDAVEAVEAIFRHGLDKNFDLRVALTAAQCVRGDRSKLERVVTNLVLNARDAMPTGGRIEVRTRDEGEFVLLEVEDEGPGVPVEVRERIFEPFFSTKGEGRHASAGLGLAMVYGVADSHGGTISVGEGAKGGALFRMRLPATAQPCVQRPRARGIGALPGTGRVLIVDDERSLREAAIHVLTNLGYESVGAAGGAEGVAILKEDPAAIDAVILDMTMPNMDGKATYIAMKEVRADIPVLLTTGYALNEEAQSILDLGVKGFLEKPWNSVRLSRALAAILT